MTKEIKPLPNFGKITRLFNKKKIKAYNDHIEELNNKISNLLDKLEIETQRYLNDR